ncbi:MAG: TonB-dependent receptor family protein [Flavobacteriales bacterium]|jgi:outer membrane receptor protein involved in Fe transport|nr:TonB-dependent receptor family protein [Flavobacteriales bacterium]
MKKNYFLLIIAIVFSFHVLAQKNKIIVTGNVIDNATKSPVPFCTVLIKDSLTYEMKSGTTTDNEGKFRETIEATQVYFEFKFIGFETQQLNTFVVENDQINLGTIVLYEDNDMLDEVFVEAEQSQTVFRLDKKVFNVGKDLTSTGASALEVLNNVPSVNVNIEGQISLRGNQGVQILINGKPSVLASEEGNALGSITADMIEKVEVITNPSAKYDAEGTSGIINIVLKKSEKKGLNGSVTINTGIPNNHSLGFSLNKRTEKLNLFSQLGIGKRTMLNNTQSNNRNNLSDTTLTSIGESDKNETFFNLILGMDYHFNKRNVLTISGHYAFEDELENSSQDYYYSALPINVTPEWNRTELTRATNPKWEYELQYKKEFKKNKEQNLLFSATGNSFSKKKTSDFTNSYTNTLTEDDLQKANTDFKENEYTFKLDYIHPFSKKTTFETGTQYIIDNVYNQYEVTDFIANSWIANTDFNNTFNFNQKVLGLYSTLAYETDKWGLKGGLRAENTDLDTRLVNTNESNSRNYTNLFPSVHTSYKINKVASVQAGYTKRIYRPRLWDLNPFNSFRDNFNLSTGNPNLTPEYSNSFEINTIYSFDKVSFNIGVFHLRTADVIERIIDFQNNVTITQPENIGTNNSTGIELNAKYTPIKWITFVGEFNYNEFIRRGNYQNVSFDFNGDKWYSRLSTKVKLKGNITLEVAGNYNSSYQTVQGEYSDNAYMNIGVRKKMLKGKLNANLSVRDVFASRFREFKSNQTSFDRYVYSMRGRYITFGLSFGFGKGEAMEFSGQKRF